MLTPLDVQPTLPPQIEDPYSAARVVSTISGLAALWLLGTPILYFGVSEQMNCLNEFVCASVILCLIGARLLKPALTAPAAFTNAGIAAWIIVSPWILGFQSTDARRWINDMWVGTAILLFSLFSGSFTYLANKRRPALERQFPTRPY